jgi:Trk K+ transport system NAD-binding subunit
MVTAITRNDHTFIPVPGTDFKEGDLAYILVSPAAMPRLEEMLGMERR